MKIQWKGHSCFILTSQTGTTVLTDPFDDRVGYPLPNVVVDVVTVSHQHFDHNSANLLPGAPLVVEGPDPYQAQGIELRGISTFHDPEQGSKRGPNTIFVINVDGVKVCHLGDLGHILSPEQAAEIGPIDVLCIPVGGFYTIDVQQARQTVEQLQPAIVLPMHYKYDPSIELPIAPVTDFLEFYPQAERAQALELDKATMPQTKRVVVLKLT